jgi:hypothetical protein
MYKYKRYAKVFLVILSCWIFISFLISRFDSSSDGYNEIGFPFVFYRSFFGKCFECKEVGLLWDGFVLDIGIVLLIAFFLQIMLWKKNRVKSANR